MGLDESRCKRSQMKQRDLEPALVLGGALALAFTVAHFDGFERMQMILARHEHLEIDELLPALLLFVAAAAWIAIRHNRKLRRILTCRTASQEAAQTLARIDPLTGLGNRRALMDHVSEQRASPEPAGLTIFLVDLDRFKEVNDLFGHRAGDIVLREIAARFRALQAEFSELQIVRLGGDEFAFVIGGTDNAQIASLGRRIVDAAAAPITIEEARSVRVGASVGQASVLSSERFEEALAQADAAMYEAKRAARELGGARIDDPLSRWGRRLFEQSPSLGEDAACRPVFTAILGIDRFTTVRSTIGHDLSSQLMRELGERLRGVGAEINMERLAPDLFGIAFHATDDAEAAELVYEFREIAEGPITLGEHLVDVTVTIGYAGPGRPGELRTLLEQAQIALDQARGNHRRQAIFNGADYGNPSDRLALMREMRAALENGQMSLAYQPKLRARDNTIDSVEALVRWKHPERGMIAPDNFVKIAEETGNIREMTEWVLRRAVLDERRFASAGIELMIHVNLSARLVSDDDFVRRILALIQGAGGSIGLEITETAVIDDPENALANLRILAGAGISLSIDDYGAGMSSLIYLKQLPVRELKIDRQFIRDITSSHRDPMIVRSTIDLAHGLGMEVTAEGVESLAALALLRVMGCDLVQGYIVAKPMPLEDMITFFRDAAWKKLGEEQTDFPASLTALAAVGHCQSKGTVSDWR